VEIIYLADAGADPGAMVVELADTIVAHSAVGAAWGPVVAACGTPLCVHGVSIHLVLLCQPLLSANQITHIRRLF